MITRHSEKLASSHWKAAVSIAVLAQAGLMSAVLAMPAASVMQSKTEEQRTRLSAQEPVHYLAQKANDGYATVPHLRPKPEVSASSGNPASSAATAPATGSGVAVPQGRRPAALETPPPRDSRDSDRK